MKKLILITCVVLVALLFFGCTTSNQEQSKQQYFSFLEKYISTNHNYFAVYELIDNRPPEKAINWVNSGVPQSLIPSTKFSDMLISFLSDETKFNIKIDFNLITNLTNEMHNLETIPVQDFILSDYNKSFVCAEARCGEQKPLGSILLPTKEQVIAEFSDNNFTVEILPNFPESPSDSTCFKIVESNLVNCFFDDGIISYIGDDAIYMKLKDIQRDSLTDANFILPYIPTLITAEKPIIPKEPSFSCHSVSTGFDVTDLYYQSDLNGFSIKLKNNMGKRIKLINASVEGDLSDWGFSFQDMRNGVTIDIGTIKISQDSIPYPKGTITIYYSNVTNSAETMSEGTNQKATRASFIIIEDIPPADGSATITCSGKVN